MAADLDLAQGGDHQRLDDFLSQYRDWCAQGRIDRANTLSALLEHWGLASREDLVQTYHAAVRYRQRTPREAVRLPVVTETALALPPEERFGSDKKVGTLNWRELNVPLKEVQRQLHAASSSQDYGTIDFSHVHRPICIVGLSDLHMMSWGSDLDTLERVTDEILQTPDLYVALLGDLVQMSIKLRNVVEVSDNMVSPEAQMMYLQSWLDEIAPRVLFSCWDNHAVMREEAQSGVSMYKHIMSRAVMYHNGIGHTDILLGDQIYTFAVSHVFRGRSMYNATHGQMRYTRHEAPDREVVMAGDSHIPGFTDYFEGGQWHSALNGGTLQTNSGYAKRHFSLTTQTYFPCVELFPADHIAIPYRAVKYWLATKNRAA